MKLSRSIPSLIAIALASSPFCAGASTVAYYSFDNDFTDSSGNSNDLSVATGTPTISSTAGEFVFGGGALDADSTTATEEFLSLANPLTFAAGDAWSVSFWVRRRPGTDFRSGMVMGNSSNNTDFIWTPDNPTQVQGIRLRSSANTNANFSGFPDDSGFHHWAIIADGAGNVVSYRDNAVQSSIAMDTSFSINSVAQGFSSTVQSMDGQIDELYIFDEAIDATTVGNLFNGIPEPSSLGFVGLSCLLLLKRRR